MCSERISRLGGISEQTIIENNSLIGRFLAASLRGASILGYSRGAEIEDPRRYRPSLIDEKIESSWHLPIRPPGLCRLLPI